MKDLKKLQESVTKITDQIIFKKEMISDEQVITIVQGIATKYEMTEETAFHCICMLFLKGAGNKNTPNTISVSGKNKNGEIKDVTKEDLFYHDRSELKNNYLRRLSEKLNTEISTFAETHTLDGELARQVNAYLRKTGENSLTTKERAWCSSFNIENYEIDKFSSRLIPIMTSILYDKKESTETPRPKKTTNKPAQIRYNIH